MVTHTDHDPTRINVDADPCQSALATLGLDATADENLIEIAYWCLAELARNANAGGTVPPHRLTQLNEARALVHARSSDRRRQFRAASSAPDVRGSGPSIARWALVVAALIPFVSIGLYALVLPEWGVGRNAGTLGWLYVMAVAGVSSWAVLIRAPRSLREVTVTPDQGHQLLHILPTAPLALVALSHQHLSAQAKHAGDDQLCSLLTAARAAVEGSRRAHEDTVRESDLAADPPCAAHIESAVSRPPHSTPERAARMVGSVPHGAEVGGPDGDHPRPGIRRAAPLRVGRFLRPRRQSSHLEQASRSVTAEQGSRNAATPEFRDQVGVLMIRRSGELVQRLILSEGSVYTIGAAPACQIRLTSSAREGHNTVADEHARLAIRRGGVLFHHLATDSVSRINGDVCTWAILEPEDEISVGEYRCRYICTE